MSKNITQKIREMLTPEDLKIFESAVESMISDKVGDKLGEMVQLKESELQVKYEKLAEEYVKKTVAKKLVSEKAKLVEGYDKKLALLEQKIVTKLDSYLNHVISEQISDDMLEKIAINETLAPVVEGIRNVFTENHLKVNSKAQGAIDSLRAEMSELKTELTESIDKRIQLEGKLEQSAVYLLISEKTNGLTKTDKQKVVEMFKDKDFDEVDGKIDNYLGLIKESYSPKAKIQKSEQKKSTKTSVRTVNEGAVVDTKKEAKVVRQEPDASTMMNDIANRFLI
jgi:hypothetical protein